MDTYAETDFSENAQLEDLVKPLVDTKEVEKTEKKKMGRPPGSKTKTTDSEKTDKKPILKKKKVVSESDIVERAQKIKGMHHAMAVMSKLPELDISDFEAALLSSSIADVEKEFGIDFLGGKVGAILGLAVATGIVYGPKASLVKEALSKKRQESQNG